MVSAPVRFSLLLCALQSVELMYPLVVAFACGIAIVKLDDNAPPPVNGAVVLTVRLVVTCDDVALST